MTFDISLSLSYSHRVSFNLIIIWINNKACATQCVCVPARASTSSCTCKRYYSVIHKWNSHPFQKNNIILYMECQEEFHIWELICKMTEPKNAINSSSKFGPWNNLFCWKYKPIFKYIYIQNKINKHKVSNLYNSSPLEEIFLSLLLLLPLLSIKAFDAFFAYVCFI